VVVEETGLSAHVPTGEAILPFADVDEAAAALATVEDGYARRCARAREIGAETFDAGRILRRLLADAGL